MLSSYLYLNAVFVFCLCRLDDFLAVEHGTRRRLSHALKRRTVGLPGHLRWSAARACSIFCFARAINRHAASGARVRGVPVRTHRTLSAHHARKMLAGRRAYSGGACLELALLIAGLALLLHGESEPA